LVAALLADGATVEVETNGTRPPPAWAGPGVRFNVSPKLASAGNAAARCALHPAWRSLPQACFKFVCTHPTEAAQVAALGLPPARVWLMPEARTVAALDAGLARLAPLALARGYHLSDRLHIRLWGDARGH
jgi:organic radical activating enzyme